MPASNFLILTEQQIRFSSQMELLLHHSLRHPTQLARLQIRSCHYHEVIWLDFR
jgi:hypothetical protein